MDMHKDSGVSPVIATVLLIALSVVLIALVTAVVMAGINSFTPVENKVVGFTVEVNATNNSALITPVSGTDRPFMESYRVYTNNGHWDSSDAGELTIPQFNSTVTYVNIVGNFTDHVTALVFSGKVVVEGGVIVVEPTESPYYVVGEEGYDNVSAFAESINDWYNRTYGTTYPVVSGDSNTLVFSNDEPILVGDQPIVISEENLGYITSGNFQVILTGDGSIQRAPGYTGALFIIGTGSNKVTITDGTLILDGDKQNTSAESAALIIEVGATLDLQNYGSLIVKDNYNAASGGNGGGIYNGGTFTVSGSDILIRILNNTATNGGGIYNAGTLNKLSNTYIEYNHATSLGGAIYNSGTVKNSVITYSGNTVGPSYTPEDYLYP